MLVKRLEEFRNIHKGKNIIVCGCGMSLLGFKERHKEFITIGVNDVPALFDPTYMMVTDHPNRFNDRRKKLVNESKSKHLFACVPGWRHSSVVNFKLGKKGAANLDDPTKIDHFLNSPYTASNLAFKMGALNIGLIGVDFTDGHFYSPKDGQHSLSRMRYLKDLNNGYGILTHELAKRNIGYYNLSKDSNITALPKISIDEFKEL